MSIDGFCNRMTQGSSRGTGRFLMLFMLFISIFHFTHVKSAQKPRKLQLPSQMNIWLMNHWRFDVTMFSLNLAILNKTKRVLTLGW